LNVQHHADQITPWRTVSENIILAGTVSKALPVGNVKDAYRVIKLPPIMASFLRLPTRNGYVVINVDHIQYYSKDEDDSTRIVYSDDTSEIVNIRAMVLGDLLSLSGHTVIAPIDLIKRYESLGHSKDEAKQMVLG
jgi:hypothetical protein